MPRSREGLFVAASESLRGTQRHPPCFAWSSRPVPGRDGDHDSRFRPAIERSLSTPPAVSNTRPTADFTVIDRGRHPSPERGGGTARSAVGGAEGRVSVSRATHIRL